MPAYIVLDVSGIPKDVLYKKHMEIKSKITKALPAQYKDPVKDEID